MNILDTSTDEALRIYEAQADQWSVTHVYENFGTWHMTMSRRVRISKEDDADAVNFIHVESNSFRGALVSAIERINNLPSGDRK